MEYVVQTLMHNLVTMEWSNGGVGETGSNPASSRHAKRSQLVGGRCGDFSSGTLQPDAGTPEETPVEH